MFRKTIFTVTTGLTLCLGLTDAHACQGPQFESSVIFGAPPVASVGAEFIGKVDVRLKNIWLVPLDDSHGFYGRVLESSTHPELVGRNIEVPKIVGTSCGPYLDAGSKGYIFGDIGPSKTAEFKVHPKSLRFGDIMITMPPQNN